jgi:hypothetical protein
MRPSFERYREAYKRMVYEAGYRPAVVEWVEPPVPAELEAEADKFATELLDQDDAMQFVIPACTSVGGQAAMAFLLHAAKAICAVDYDLAAELILMAQGEIMQRLEPCQ